MYGLAVNLIMSVSGHPSIINEISWMLPFAYKSKHYWGQLVKKNLVKITFADGSKLELASNN